MYITNIKTLRPISIKVDNSDDTFIHTTKNVDNITQTFGDLTYQFNKIKIFKTFSTNQTSITSSGYNNITGDRNLFIGYLSGFKNEIGNDILCLGTESGYNNKTSNLISMGFRAGFNNTIGNNNIYIGTESGFYNSTGNESIFIGSQAGKGSTEQISASNIICIGAKTGYKNKTGFNNIFLGGYAGYNNTTGNNNIFIGTGKDTTYSSNTIPDINSIISKNYLSEVSSQNISSLLKTNITASPIDDIYLNLQQKLVQLN